MIGVRLGPGNGLPQLTLTLLCAAAFHCIHPSIPSLGPQVCDLASLASIKALAEEYLATGQPLDVLVNK